MGKQSAGLLLYRRGTGGLEVFLVHPGGPFYRRKDLGVWSVPKGEHEPSEDAVAVALREFSEETGSSLAIDRTDLIALGSVTQRSGKIVSVWAASGDLDASQINSNTFSIEWPPQSGQTEVFPEVDRAAWFDLDTAKMKLLPAQAAFVDRLAAVSEPLGTETDRASPPSGHGQCS